MSRASIQKAAFRVVSQIGIHYRKSTLSQSTEGLPGSAPRAGDRFPWLHLRLQPDGPVEDVFQKLDDTRFNLIVIGQPSPSEAAPAFGDLLRIHAIPVDPVNDVELARVQIPSVSYYLVRPDGHVGLCGARLDVAAIARYASERLRLGIGSAVS
jgi:hypothetical protein